MEHVLGWLLSLLVDVVLLGTGQVIVRVVSFGRWRGESLGTKEGRIHGAAGALAFKRNGQRVVTASGLLFVGMSFWVCVGVLLLGWTAHVGSS